MDQPLNTFTSKANHTAHCNKLQTMYHRTANSYDSTKVVGAIDTRKHAFRGFTLDLIRGRTARSTESLPGIVPGVRQPLRFRQMLCQIVAVRLSWRMLNTSTQ